MAGSSADSAQWPDGLKKSQEVSDVIAYLKQFAADDKQASAVRAELEVIER
jgi:hypothetical protein